MAERIYNASELSDEELFVATMLRGVAAAAQAANDGHDPNACWEWRDFQVKFAAVFGKTFATCPEGLWHPIYKSGFTGLMDKGLVEHPVKDPSTGLWGGVLKLGRVEASRVWHPDVS